MASVRTIINSRTQALVGSERTQIRTQVCLILFYLSSASLSAMPYPGEPRTSAPSHHLLESCLLGTGTGFGSTTNTGGFGSTNTTGGGLFGGGSSGFGSTGGMSTMLCCSGIFCWFSTSHDAVSNLDLINVMVFNLHLFSPTSLVDSRMIRNGSSARYTGALVI